LKDYILRTLRFYGIDVRNARKNPNLTDFLIHRHISLVLDIGANVGQFGDSLRRHGYRGKIVSFEPVKAVFRQLARRAIADGNWDAYDCAIGASPGQATINVSEDSQFSSMLGLRGAAKTFDANSAVATTETVNVQTLDEVALSMTGETLIKVDTQGLERQVLEGGRKTLARAKGVLMELPIIRLYEGGWHFHEAVEFMSSLDFVPTQIHPVNYHSKDKMALVEVDCLFRPRDSRID
jgi:FkbM family methyltransferase